MADAVAEQVRLGLHPVIDLSELVEKTKRTELRPLAFFVSWHGVLTLAYSGFPEPLANLKAQINEHLTLPRENAGSKWPKTSFAALRDGHTLTQAQLAVVQSICTRHSVSLPQLCVKVKELAIVNYANRCLEKVITVRRISLASADVDASVSDAQRENVERVLREGDDPNYWTMVAKDGSRESHYRDYAPGCTLLVPLDQADANDLKRLFESIQQDLELELPGYYTFFDAASRHVTLRAISG